MKRLGHHRSRSVRTARSALVAAMLFASPALGQDADGASLAQPEAELGLRPGATVHVAAPSVGQLEARLVRATGRELLLSAGGTEHTVRLGAGDSLWVLGHSARQGVKAGAVSGLVVTSALVALFFSICRNGTDDPCTGAENFVPAGAFLVGTGALVGGGIGRLLPRWELRWPSRR